MEEPVPGDPRVDSFNAADGPLGNDHSKDGQEGLNHGGSLHFSRKRGHHTQEDEADLSRDGGLDEQVTHTPKRSRSSRWPQPPDAAEQTQAQKEPHKRISAASSMSGRQASTPGRSSRFQEASMHDRVSEKPPSAFTRLFHSTAKSPSVDHLMEDYMAASSEGSTVRLPGRHAHKPAQMKGLTHHANASTTGTATTADSRRSGLFRFGRSLASSFNPVNIWQKMATNWNEAREELVDERTKEFMERQAKAEHAYAELKKTGQIGPQGTLTAMTTGLKPSVPGFVSPATHRDSGISGMDNARVSAEYNSDTSHGPDRAQLAVPEKTAHRKSSFHFRTPSLTNLKKVKSEINLKPKQSSVSLSPEKELPQLPDEQRSLRKAQSKKDLVKQQKLTKRVSDLEAKLQEARRELVAALNDAPPVPQVPSPFRNGAGGNERNRSASPSKRNFVPGALPSVPSERLLSGDNTITASKKDSAHRSKKSTSHAELSHAELSHAAPAAPQPTEEAPHHGLHISNPIPHPVPHHQPDYLTPLERSRRSPIDELAAPHFEPPASPQPTTKKSPAKKTPTARKRKPSASKEDLRFRPSPDSDGDDDEWDVARASKPAKKKRASPKKANGKSRHHDEQGGRNGVTTTTTHQTTTITHSVVPATPAPALAPAPAPAPPPQLPPVEEDADAAARTSLETVEEESTMTITVLLNDEPVRPTAFATPAHPGRHATEGEGESSPVRVVPGVEGVPEMPNGAGVRGKKSFEWPDDVF